MGSCSEVKSCNYLRDCMIEVVIFNLKLNFKKSVIHIVFVAQRLYDFLDCDFFILVKY